MLLKKIWGISILLTFAIAIYGQDSLLTQIALSNAKNIHFDGKTFSGEGWLKIQKAIVEHSNILIGEDHFTNEIPTFTKAIFNTSKFDNFYIEVDPFSTKIIENAIRHSNREEQQQFYEKYKSLFSFYSLQPEFDLLEHVVLSGTDLLGSDQIVAYADRLLFQDLLSKTKNKEAKVIYKEIMEQSHLHLEDFFTDPKKPMYFKTPDFSLQLNKLDSLSLSKEEKAILHSMKQSTLIYSTRSHKKRIQLIKHYLLNDLPKWKNKKNLFKYGAMHMARGESFLTIYDVGNLVANITDSNFEQSFHLMVIAKSGMQGSPFKVFPPSKIDIENGLLKSFKIFYDISSNDNWQVFDLLPIRKAVFNGELEITDITLLRAIKGYDALVIIPKVTPAQF